MRTPLEETVTLSNDFTEFMTTFPGIYRKISQRLNRNVDIEKSTVHLWNAYTTVYSFATNDTQSFLYFVRGEDPSKPMASGFGVCFSDNKGFILPIANHTPSNLKIDIRIENGELRASVTSGGTGFGVYEFNLIFF